MKQSAAPAQAGVNFSNSLNVDNTVEMLKTPIKSAIYAGQSADFKQKIR